MRDAKWPVVLLLFLCSVAMRAEKVQQLSPSNYVNDFAHVLTPDTTERLNTMCREIDEKAQAQISVVTINSLEGEPIEDFANQLFRQWGIGGKKSNRGVLILFAMQDRQYRVEVGYGLEGILNDAKVGTLAREAVPQLRVGDFSGAALYLTGRIADVIAADAQAEPVSGLPPARAPAVDYPPHHSAPPMGLILGGIGLIFVLMLFPGGRTLLWLLLAAVFSGRGGGYSGGGGGGGGFGGFGGGSSGGGGASGSW